MMLDILNTIPMVITQYVCQIYNDKCLKIFL